MAMLQYLRVHKKRIHGAVSMLGNVYAGSAVLTEVCRKPVLISELLKEWESTVFASYCSQWKLSWKQILIFD